MARANRCVVTCPRSICEVEYLHNTLLRQVQVRALLCYFYSIQASLHGPQAWLIAQKKVAAHQPRFQMDGKSLKKKIGDFHPYGLKVASS